MLFALPSIMAGQLVRFNHWAKQCLMDFYNEKWQSCKLILTDAHIEKIKQQVQENHHQLKGVQT